MAHRTIFFDLDGTLTDPREGIVKCFQYALEHLGFPAVSEEMLVSFIGPPIQDSFAKLVDGGSPDFAAKGVSLYRERFSTKGMYENRLYEGIGTLLESLSGNGHTLYVVTTKPKVYAEEIVEHFGIARYFEGVYGPTLSGIRKDKAHLIAYLLDEENIFTANALMIGDRSYDIAGAKANDVASIGVLWGYGSAEELTEAGADRLCESPEELRDVLR
jgi:phosphoglycolate phosphatase